MILLTVLAAVLAISLLAGGRLAHLAQVSLRSSLLVLAGLGLQLLVFSSWWRGQASLAALVVPLYVLSMALLGLFCWLNRRVPGMVVLGVGWLLNMLAIAANGGRMPASLGALRAAGLVPPDAGFETLRATNSALMGPETRLWFLCDILAVPQPFPLANVLSVGDLLIAAGGAWFLWAHMRPARSPMLVE